MAEIRQKQVKLNIVVTILCQLVTIACGVIVPKLYIDAFGSEAYGATSSITQFLAYITLLEGGVASVARAALYRPLADNDTKKIGLIMGEIRRFFSIIAYIFLAYVIVLACSYKYISNTQFMDWSSTFLLVIVISISTFAQYFIGISYAVLLHAAQKTYVINGISLWVSILNAMFISLCIWSGMDLIAVKFVSSLVFAIKPIAMWLYVRKEYKLPKSNERDPGVLKQKWNGLSQHIAYFLHYNTDIAVLTVCADLTTVAVYSVYNMIVHHIQNLAVSFSAGMEALFGDLLAKREEKQLHKWFGYYETLISSVTTILFPTTAVLVVPFVKLYTANVQDAEYIQPVFAIILVYSSAIYCLRLPYHSMVIAAGRFKQTQMAAYGEAGINIILSLILVDRFGLAGVAFATLIATVFRFGYYVVYLSRHICKRNFRLFAKRFVVNVLAVAIVSLLDLFVLKVLPISNYFTWALNGVVMAAIAGAVSLLLNLIFYRKDTAALSKSVLNKFNNKKQF